MERTDVIIVGAGPSGLALAIALAHHHVKSVILEKNQEICEDPRAIALAGDSHRIIQLLGITQEKLRSFAQRLTTVNFHADVFTSGRPFLSLNHGSDGLQQAVPGATCILQPKLEETLRSLLQDTDLASLRTRCEVTACREDADGVQVTYAKDDGTMAVIEGAFLVGADGKRGIVRKDFLEPKGVQQLVGIHDYAATWIAANLRITPPTPETHPDFPLWAHNVTPEQVWDIFWPSGFHFCNDALMPVATGRFGPAEDRYWRFEYELPPGEPTELAQADPEGHLEAQMARHLTISPARLRQRGIHVTQPVKFPWDCVQIVRCGPAFFAHKVVNRWFDNRTILIGDAAHVFPPFGAQGIANGLRDALALAWRLGVVVNRQVGADGLAQVRHLLDGWSRERRRGVDDASKDTMQNGRLLLNKSRVLVVVLRMFNALSRLLPSLFGRFMSKTLASGDGYVGVAGGFFLPDAHGGGKVAQTWVRRRAGGPLLSDQLFWRSCAVFTLLALAPLNAREATELRRIVNSTELPARLLATEIFELQPEQYSELPSVESAKQLNVSPLWVCTAGEAEAAGFEVLPGHDPHSFRRRFPPSTRFVLVRPDYIIFSQAKTVEELERHLKDAAAMLRQSP